MDMRTICIKSSSISLKIILKNLRFGDHIYNIETETFDTFALPETDDFF